MNKYVVSYDLNKEGQRYDLIIHFLERLPIAIKVLESFWLVKTDKSIDELSDNINAILDGNDEYLVVKFDEFPYGFLHKATIQKIKEEF
ncbi:hypothetical protein [Staphylococcus hominis]